MMAGVSYTRVFEEGYTNRMNPPNPDIFFIFLVTHKVLGSLDSDKAVRALALCSTWNHGNMNMFVVSAVFKVLCFFNEKSNMLFQFASLLSFCLALSPTFEILCSISSLSLVRSLYVLNRLVFCPVLSSSLLNLACSFTVQFDVITVTIFLATWTAGSSSSERSFVGDAPFIL